MENYRARMKELYGEHADEVLKLYPAASEQQMTESAGALAGDRWIAYSTWKWIDQQMQTGGEPVYRYHFEQAPPQPEGKPSRGAYHSADIEYVFETLESKNLPWTEEDRKLSRIMSSYWTNFAKNGNPNGAGLPKWPQNEKQDGYQVMHLIEGPHTSPHAAKDTVRARYELIEKLAAEKANAATPNSATR
jgi:para-nitrobenzyl esterase